MGKLRLRDVKITQVLGSTNQPASWPTCADHLLHPVQLVGGFGFLVFENSLWPSVLDAPSACNVLPLTYFNLFLTYF